MNRRMQRAGLQQIRVPSADPRDDGLERVKGSKAVDLAKIRDRKYCSACAKSGRKVPGPFTVLEGTFCRRHAHQFSKRLRRRARQVMRTTGVATHGHTAEPIRVDRPGRNEPCPCGLGRKFKKCCGG